jgi:hypothetical protein
VITQEQSLIAITPSGPRPASFSIFKLIAEELGFQFPVLSILNGAPFRGAWLPERSAVEPVRRPPIGRPPAPTWNTENGTRRFPLAFEWAAMPISRAVVMAFLIYFFVLLMIATSVLFGLDWVNAPLHPPAQQERTQAASTPRNTGEHVARQKPPPQTPPVLIGRTQPLPLATAPKPETVGQQPEAETAQQPPETTAETAPPAPPQPKQAETSPAPSKPEPVAQQKPPAEPVAQSKPEPIPPPQPKHAETSPAQSKPEPVAQQKPPAEKAARSEPAKPAAAPEAKKTEAKRKEPRPAPRPRVARRPAGERVPDWALRGAEDAERDADYERRSGGAPGWAVQGAEAARREAEYGGQRPPGFVPFWERETGWHFR